MACLCVAVVLSGCATPPAAVSVAQEAQDDWVVTATRVEPVVHPVLEQGSVSAGACVRPSCQVPSWEEPAFDFGDPEALFWRVMLDLKQGTELGPSLDVAVFATTPCGPDCVKLRRIEWRADESGLAASDAMREPSAEAWEPNVRFEVFPKDGETGVRVVLEATSPTAMPVGSRSYSLVGAVAGYRPAGDPIRLD